MGETTEKHTPGPWFVFGNGHCVGGPCERPGEAEQTGGIAMCGMRLRSPEEAAANARLIAAAPALLAACKLAMKFIEIGNVEGAWDRSSAGESLGDMLTAALAAAKELPHAR